MHGIKILKHKRSLSQVTKSDIIYILCELSISAIFALGTNLMGFAPFGIGLLCGISYCGTLPLFSLVGVVFSSVIMGDYAQGCSALLFVLLLTFFTLLPKQISYIGKTLLLLLSQILVFPLFYNAHSEIFMYVFISLSFSFFFAKSVQYVQNGIRKTLRGHFPSAKFHIHLLIFFTATIFCFSKINIFSINTASVFLVFLMLISIHVVGIKACAFSILWGGAYIIASHESILFMGILCICSLLASLCLPYGKIYVSIVFVGASALFTFVSEINYIFIAEAFIGTLLFMLLPKKIIRKAELWGSKSNTIKSEASLLCLQEKLLNSGNIICDTAKIFSRTKNSEAKLMSHALLSAGKLMQALANEKVEKKKRFSVKVGACACVKAGNEETGDSITVKEYNEYVLLALSDGMGSGKAAHKESNMVVTLLADLLYAGFPMSDALEYVNILMLKRSENDMYATLDAVKIDRTNGSAEFIKHGACSSFIVRGEKIITVSSSSLPIGIIETARASHCSIKLCRGDFIFLMSDGVSEALNSRLCDVLLDVCLRIEDVNLAAEELLYIAQTVSQKDDMTVLSMQIM